MVALGIPLLAAYLIGRTLPAELFASTQVLASCLFACTGLLCMVSWRLVGYSRSAYVGCCFAVLGLLTVVLPLVGSLLPDGNRVGLVAPLARISIALAALTLVFRASSSPPVVARLRIRRLLAETAVIAAALYGCLVAVMYALGPAAHTRLYMVVEALLTGAWVIAGVVLVQRARAGRIGGWCAMTLLLIAGQECLRLGSVVNPRPWMFAAGTGYLVAAGVALAGAGSGLLTILRHQDRSFLGLKVDLRASEGLLSGARERQEERLHDVRSALAGIRCANGTLHRYAERLDERTRATLEDALTRELGRLEELVDPTIENPLVDFSVADLLMPLVSAESSQGSEILLSAGRVFAHGRPRDTAAVVQNLIVNARRYAPGSVVTIHAWCVDGRVKLQVEDSGPGIPVRERAAVFERGVRGSTAAGVAGTGLGLFVSRRLMTEQHGSLSLREGAAGGACFVLDLPAALADPLQGQPDLVEVPDIDDARPAADLLERPDVPQQSQRQVSRDIPLASLADHRDIKP